MIPVGRLGLPASAREASEQLREPGACAMGGGTDLLPQVQRGITEPGADRRLARRRSRLARPPRWRRASRGRSPAWPMHSQPTRSFASGSAYSRRGGGPGGHSPTTRDGDGGGNLCQRVRCWYFRHPDLACWLRRRSRIATRSSAITASTVSSPVIASPSRHPISPAPCSPSRRRSPRTCASTSRSSDLYRRPPPISAPIVALASGEFVTSGHGSVHTRFLRLRALGGERGESSFALVGVSAARFGERIAIAAIGVANTPRVLAPDDPLEGLPGLPMTGWKRTALATLARRCQRASHPSSPSRDRRASRRSNDAPPSRAGRDRRPRIRRLGPIRHAALDDSVLLDSVSGLPLVYSFGTQDYLTAKMSFGWTLESWRALYDPVVYGAFLRSVRLSTEATIFCALLGYPLDLFRRPPRRAVSQPLALFLIVAPFWVSFIVRAYAWIAILGHDGTCQPRLRVGWASGPSR